MTVRLSLDAPLNDPTSPYRPHAKVAHRADPRIGVLSGSHDVVSDLKRMHGLYPADVLHFPFRAREQYERKGVRRARGDKPLGQYVKAFEASERGRVEDAYGSLRRRQCDHGQGAGGGKPRCRYAASGCASGAATGARAACFAAGPGRVEEDVRAVAEETALYEANLVRARRSIDVLNARLRVLEEHAWGASAGPPHSPRVRASGRGSRTCSGLPYEATARTRHGNCDLRLRVRRTDRSWTRIEDLRSRCVFTASSNR